MIITKPYTVIVTDPAPFDPYTPPSDFITVDRSGAPDTAPLSWVWTAPSGDRWNLTDLDSPVVKLRGATGLGGATPEHWWSESPMNDGAEWAGYRTPRGELFLPLMVQGFGSADFLAQHRRFRASLHPGREGLMTVIRPDGSSRSVACRYASGADAPVTLDPVALGRATYGITWSTDPFWSGDPIERTFVFDAGLPFFPGPPFILSDAFRLNDATVSNPGDVSAHPSWRINAPFTSVRVGVGDAFVRLNQGKSSGYIDIDMRPSRLTVVDETGADRWDMLADAEFADIPAGDGIPLVLSVIGGAPGTSVRLAFTPRYTSAW